MSRSNKWMTLNALAERLNMDRCEAQDALAAVGLLDPYSLLATPAALFDSVARICVAGNGQALTEWHAERVRIALATYPREVTDCD